MTACAQRLSNIRPQASAILFVDSQYAQMFTLLFKTYAKDRSVLELQHNCPI